MLRRNNTKIKNVLDNMKNINIATFCHTKCIEKYGCNKWTSAKKCIHNCDSSLINMKSGIRDQNIYLNHDLREALLKIYNCKKASRNATKTAGIFFGLDSMNSRNNGTKRKQRVYVTKRGTKYIRKVSKKTGKVYKKYI